MLIRAYKNLILRLWAEALPPSVCVERYPKAAPVVFEHSEQWADDLIKRGHIFIAGQTGSGKSNLLKFLLQSVIVSGGDLVLIDPKKIDLYKFRGNALKYTSEIDGIVSALNFGIDVMEERYHEMQSNGVDVCKEKPLYIVVDELADIITTNKKQIMPLLQRLANLGRAARVFLILCTQAPNRQTVPANLLLNMGVCIALKCFSGIESRQIIGVKGAENLPKFGKAIIKTDSLQILDVPLFSEM